MSSIVGRAMTFGYCVFFLIIAPEGNRVIGFNDSEIGKRVGYIFPDVFNPSKNLRQFGPSPQSLA